MAKDGTIRQHARPSRQRESFRGDRGKSGCGCLVFLLVLSLICLGVLAHPMSLKLIAKQLNHEDKIIPSDVVFVHRFMEDKSGELYTEAFRQYWAGNARAICVEEDKVFGVSMQDIVGKTGRAKGIKENVVKAISVDGDETAKVKKIKARLQAMGYRKIIVLVPEYASGRFHLLYGTSDEKDRTIYMIKPVHVSYFKRDTWWKDSLSRVILVKELYGRAAHYASRFGGSH